MIDLFNFFVVADRRYTRDSIAYGLFYTEKEAELFRTRVHPTAKIFKCNYSNLKVDEYGIKVNTNNLLPLK